MKNRLDVQAARHQSHKVMTESMVARLRGCKKYPRTGWSVYRKVGDDTVLLYISAYMARYYIHVPNLKVEIMEACFPLF
jgi:hypothetical protein